MGQPGMKDAWRSFSGHAWKREIDVRDFVASNVTPYSGDGGFLTGPTERAFTGRVFRAAKLLGLHTALDTSGFLGARATGDYLQSVDLVLLDIKSWDADTYRRVAKRDVEPTLLFAERLAATGEPVWVRCVLVPGLTDDPANVEGVAKFIAPMKNVEWVEVLPFHQLGAFKWKQLGLEYTLAEAPPASPELVARALGQFRDAGCNAR